MNDRKEKIEREVGETLALFDEIETIEASPYFSTRLEAKLESLDKKEKPFFAGVFKPGVLRPALIACLITINVFSAVLFFRGSGEQTESREESLQAFARSYGLIETEDETSGLLG